MNALISEISKKITLACLACLCLCICTLRLCIINRDIIIIHHGLLIFIAFFLFQWKADKNNTLSGRIIRLNITCNYATASKKPFNGCLLFKAVGTVTCEYAVIQTWCVVHVHLDNILLLGDAEPKN